MSMARDNSIAQHMYTHRLNYSARHNSCSMPAHKAAVLKAYDWKWSSQQSSHNNDYYYIPSPNPQKRIRPTDEVINDESNDEMMMKVINPRRMRRRITVVVLCVCVCVCVCVSACYHKISCLPRFYVANKVLYGSLWCFQRFYRLAFPENVSFKSSGAICQCRRDMGTPVIWAPPSQYH